MPPRRARAARSPAGRTRSFHLPRRTSRPRPQRPGCRLQTPRQRPPRHCRRRVQQGATPLTRVISATRPCCGQGGLVCRSTRSGTRACPTSRRWRTSRRTYLSQGDSSPSPPPRARATAARSRATRSPSSRSTSRGGTRPSTASRSSAPATKQTLPRSRSPWASASWPATSRTSCRPPLSPWATVPWGQSTPYRSRTSRSARRRTARPATRSCSWLRGTA
mmetsp:Transcript_97241/g.251552  ORF Transcript_97241/g.251552 Transcript_97241/m.251552 type:complete len:220 (+) Transcript_97241:207-866(+)